MIFLIGFGSFVLGYLWAAKNYSKQMREIEKNIQHCIDRVKEETEKFMSEVDDEGRR